MKLPIQNLLLIVCLSLASISSGFAYQESNLPCGEPANLQRDKRGKPLWYSSEQMKKRTESRVLPTAPLLHMRGQVVVVLLVNAEGEVVCAKSMNRHPLAVKLLEERVSRLRFKPVKSKGAPVSTYGLLTLYVEYGCPFGNSPLTA
jgi:hypothetical protein